MLSHLHFMKAANKKINKNYMSLNSIIQAMDTSGMMPLKDDDVAPALADSDGTISDSDIEFVPTQPAPICADILISDASVPH